MKILLLGKDGQVGWELQRSLAPLGELLAWGREEADLRELDVLRARVRAAGADVIVNAAAYTAVDRAEADEANARLVNALAPGVLADEARASGAWLLHYSTDYVFDGRKEGAWTEQDATNPLSAYGRSKCEGEERIRASGARHLILRTSWVFGAHGANFAKTMLRLAHERDALDVVADQHGAPTGAALLADASALALYRLMREGAGAHAFAGTYHVAAGGVTTWHAYAEHVLARARAHGALLKAQQLRPIAASAFAAAAPRPANSRLDCSKFEGRFGLALPDWRHHVDRMLVELLQGKP
jgi:dTDP-4-dehydrorhamnose reductase